MAAFSISCITCQTRLKVKDASAIGQILSCPKCGSMVEVIPPPGWQPGDEEQPDAAPDQAAAPQPRAEETLPRPEASSSTEQLIQTWLVRLSLLTAAVIVGGGIWLFASRAADNAEQPQVELAAAAETEPEPAETEELPGDEQEPQAEPAVEPQSEPETSPAEPPAEPVVAAVPDGEQPTERKTAKPALPDSLVGWLPRDAKLIVSLRTDQLAGQKQLAAIASPEGALWRQWVRPLEQTLATAAAQVERMTWTVSDLSHPERSTAIFVQLSDSAAQAADLTSRFAPLRANLAGAEGFRAEDPAWPHPFAAINARTLVTAPVSILEALAARAQQAPPSDAAQQIQQRIEEDWQVVVSLDLGAARQANWNVQPALLTRWGIADDDWSRLQGLEGRLDLHLHLAQPQLVELALHCRNEETAGETAQVLDRVLAGLVAPLEAEADGREDGAPLPVDFARANELGTQVDMLRELQAMVESRNVQTQGKAVLVQMRARSNVLDVELWRKLLTPPATELAADVPAERHPVTTEQVDVRRHLERSVLGFEVQDQSLSELVRLVSQLSALQITLDVEGLTQAGVSIDEPVSLQLGQTTVRGVLEAALSGLGLTFVVRQDGLLITSPERSEKELVESTYQVSDLAGDDLPRLASVVRTLVAPLSWESAGGRGSLQVDDAILKIVQQPAVHDEIGDFLDRWRSVRQAAQPVSRVRQATPLLSRPVTVNFPRETPLRQIVEYIHGRTGANLTIDALALSGEGLDPDTPATLSCNREPLSTALAELLNPLGLDWRAVDEQTLQITTKPAAEKTFDVEFYSLAGLVSADRTPAELQDALRSQVEPTTWNGFGGLAATWYDPPSGMLLVSHNQRGQWHVEQWLADQREAQDAEPAPGDSEEPRLGRKP